MSVLVFDRINTSIDPQYESPRLPQTIARIFAKAGIPVPSTGRIVMRDVDAALKSLPVEQRMAIKAELAGLKLID